MRVLQWKMLVYFTAIWSYLSLFGIFCGHLVYFFGFGMLEPEKSGNPDRLQKVKRKKNGMSQRRNSSQLKWYQSMIPKSQLAAG
jgi:hypothetical protein